MKRREARVTIVYLVMGLSAACSLSILKGEDTTTPVGNGDAGACSNDAGCDDQMGSDAAAGNFAWDASTHDANDWPYTDAGGGSSHDGGGSVGQIDGGSFSGSGMADCGPLRLGDGGGMGTAFDGGS